MFKLFNKNLEENMLPPEGSHAPDFSLDANNGHRIVLSELRGRPVILAFYPADFSSVCGSQMALYNEALPMFEELGGQLLGISVDPLDRHVAFAEAQNLRFPLLADDHPLGEVASKYGVFDERRKRARRGLFVIDGEGVIRWRYLAPDSVNPGADGILKALEDLSEEQHGDR
jgi:peroxiredoxin